MGVRILLRKIGIILIIGSLVLLVRWSQRSIDQSREIYFVDKRPVFVPNGKILTWMSLGYRGVVADWLWIKTVLYTGRRVKDEDNRYYLYVLEKGTLDKELNQQKMIVKPKERPAGLAGLSIDLWRHLYKGGSIGLIDYIYPMLDRITTIDPYFVHPYIFGGIYILMHTCEVDRAQKLLEKGYSFNPDLWMFPFYLGWIHWMYRGDLKTTHQYLLEAVSKKNCPDYAYVMLRAISSELGQNEFLNFYQS